MEKKELQSKIAKMEAGLSNPNITDSQKEIIRAAIAKAKKQLDEMDGENPKKMDFPKNISQLKEFMKNNIGEKIYHQYSRKLREGETFPDLSKPEERIIRKIQTDSFATEREGKPDPSNYSWMEFAPAKNWTFDEKGFYFQNEYVKLNYYYEKPTYSNKTESDFETGIPVNYISTKNGVEELTGEIVMRGSLKMIALYRDANYSGNSERIIKVEDWNHVFRLTDKDQKAKKELLEKLKTSNKKELEIFFAASDRKNIMIARNANQKDGDNFEEIAIIDESTGEVLFTKNIDFDIASKQKIIDMAKSWKQEFDEKNKGKENPKEMYVISNQNNEYFSRRGMEGKEVWTDNPNLSYPYSKEDIQSVFMYAKKSYPKMRLEIITLTEAMKRLEEPQKKEKNFFTLAADFTEVKAKLKKAVETNDRLEFLDDNLTRENLYFFLANKNTRNALVELYAGKDKFEDNFEEYKKSIKANTEEGKNILALFIGKSQLAASKSKEMEGVMQNVLESILNAPLIHNNTDKLYHLHYFRGDTDVYISEIDFGTGIQDYGYVILNGDRQMAENGYVSIAELLKSGLELDYYFKPISLAEIKKEAKPSIDNSRGYMTQQEASNLTDKLNKKLLEIPKIKNYFLRVTHSTIEDKSLDHYGGNTVHVEFGKFKNKEDWPWGQRSNDPAFISFNIDYRDGKCIFSTHQTVFHKHKLAGTGELKSFEGTTEKVIQTVVDYIQKAVTNIDKYENEKETKMKPKFAVGDFVSYEVGDVPVTKAEGEIKEIVFLDKEIAYRIDAYFKDSDGWLFDSSKYNEQFEVVLRPSSKAKFLINKNLFESKRKKSEEATAEKSLKVEIRPASKTSSKFVVWDLETNQIFANEKFDSVEDAKIFVSQNKMELVNVVENKATEKPKQSKEKYTISSEKTDEIVATYIAAILFNHGNDVEIEFIDETFDPEMNILEIDFELSKIIQGKKVIKKMNMKHNVAGSSLDYYPGFEMPKEIDVKKYLMEHDFSSKTKKEVYPFASFLAEHSEKHVGKKVSQKTLHTIKPEEREKLKKLYKESHQQSKEEKQLSGKLKLTKYLKAQGVTQAMIDKVNKTGEGVTFRPVKRIARGTEFDRERHALKPGKRLSAKGTIYYEYRSDMSDVGKKGL